MQEMYCAEEIVLGILKRLEWLEKRIDKLDSLQEANRSIKKKDIPNHYKTTVEFSNFYLFSAPYTIHQYISENFEYFQKDCVKIGRRYYFDPLIVIRFILEKRPKVYESMIRHSFHNNELADLIIKASPTINYQNVCIK